MKHSLLLVTTGEISLYIIDARIALKESLSQLLEKYPIGSISVIQIAIHCGVSTRTFYNYFTDKYDLMHFLYYYETENIWFTGGKLRACEEAFILLYRRWRKLYNQLSNCYSYVGQNDMRSFVVREIFSALYRLVICNREERLLQDSHNVEALYLMALAIQSAHEELLKRSRLITLHADVFCSIIPGHLYNAITKTPPTPYPEEVEIFNPEKPSWPPKFYYYTGK